MPSVRSLPKLGAAYADLARRAKLLEVVQLSLTQKLELAKTEEVKQLPAFRVMEPAEVPEQRVWPRRTAIVIMAFVFGMLTGMIVVLAQAKWNTTEDEYPFKALLLDAVHGFTARSVFRWSPIPNHLGRRH